jgi:glycosyltransferase involved in cell wall biosynthesis
MKKIVFCFPYKGVGGISVLFVRIAEYISSAGLAKCYLVDYDNGYMAQIRDPDLTELLVYPELGKVSIPDNASIVFQSITPWSMFPNIVIGKGSKLLFWNCHPLNLIPSIPGLRHLTAGTSWTSKFILYTLLIGFTVRVRRFLLFLIKNNAIVFMDGNNLRVSSECLGVKVKDPQFLSIPAKQASSRLWSQDPLADPRIIDFLWVGRIVDFKYYPLKRFLRDISEMLVAEDVSVTLTVVGTGDYYNRFLMDVDQQDKVQVRFIDHIGTDDLDRFITDNASIMLAMGTSALEGAKLGVPTLLLDFSYSEIVGEYNYRWVHQTTDYNLGELLSKNNEQATKGTSLWEKISEFKSSAEIISSREREYFLDNHDLPVVAKQLVDCIHGSSLEYQDLHDRKLMGESFVYSSFYKLRKKVKKQIIP